MARRNAGMAIRNAGIARSNAPPAPQALPAPQGLGAYITLRVIDQDGNRSLLLLRGRTRLRNLMNTYCHRQAVELNAIRFLYNGRQLTGDETPDELHMEDGHEINAIMNL